MTESCRTCWQPRTCWAPAGTPPTSRTRGTASNIVVIGDAPSSFLAVLSAKELGAEPPGPPWMIPAIRGSLPKVFKSDDDRKAMDPVALARDLLRGHQQDITARIAEEAGHFEAQLRTAEARAAFEGFFKR